MKTKYVRSKEGLYLLAIDSEILFPTWKFALHDGEKLWPRGFGVASVWTTVAESEVPEDIRRKLEKVAHTLRQKVGEK
jgi:uncharacterized protein (DUF952 family)